MKGYQNRDLEENAKYSKWNAHNCKGKHLILEQLKSSLHGSRNTYELMRSYIPKSQSVWQPHGWLLTLIFSFCFPSQKCLLMGTRTSFGQVVIRLSTWQSDGESPGFAQTMTALCHLGKGSCTGTHTRLYRPSISYQEWSGDQFHLVARTLFPLWNLFPPQSWKAIPVPDKGFMTKVAPSMLGNSPKGKG